MEEVRNPYAAPPALAEHPVDAREHTLASRGIRPGATLIGRIVYSARFVPGYIPLGLPDAASPVHYRPLGTGISVGLACCSIALFLCSLWLRRDRGQPPAKLWLGMRIVRCDGSRAAPARLFGLCRFIPVLLGAIPCLGTRLQLKDAPAIFGQKQRCAHDYVADTLVVVA